MTTVDPARFVLGQMLRLVEDGILVRSTKDDDDFAAYLQQSSRLTNVLRQAQEVLATKKEVQSC